MKSADGIRAVPPSRRAIAPASGRPMVAALSTKVWISGAVMRPLLLESMTSKMPWSSRYWRAIWPSMAAMALPTSIRAKSR